MYTVNSVKQIIEECERMVSQAECTDYVDIKNLIVTLRKNIEELKEAFDKDPGNNRLVAMCKAHVEDVAITLEFYMSIRLKLYEDRNKLRKFAAALYDDVKSACYTLTLGEDKENSPELVEWYEQLKWSLYYFTRSQHLIFENTQEDNDRIEKITGMLVELREKEGKYV